MKKMNLLLVLLLTEILYLFLLVCSSAFVCICSGMWMSTESEDHVGSSRPGVTGGSETLGIGQ